MHVSRDLHVSMSARGHHELSNIWPVQTKHQLLSTNALINLHQLGVSMVVHLEDCNKKSMHSFELYYTILMRQDHIQLTLGEGECDVGD